MLKPPSHQPQKSFLLIIVSILFLFGVGFLLNNNLYNHQLNTLEAAKQSYSAPQSSSSQPTPSENLPPVSDTPNLDAKIIVGFTPQAPTANWDELHNEACEEASAIMVAAALSHDSSKGQTVNIQPKYKTTENPPDQYYSLLDPAFVEQEITKLTNWEDKNLGYHLSTDTYETAQMIREVYNLDVKVVPYNIDEIKKIYTSGDKIIIVPTNGQLLKNPYYKPPGPIYHMLVITGYNSTQLITNDSGTKRGYNYTYDQVIVEQAAGNWTHSTGSVNLKNKLMIVVSVK